MVKIGSQKDVTTKMNTPYIHTTGTINAWWNWSGGGEV